MKVGERADQYLKSEDTMTLARQHFLSRRGFCLCCMTASAVAATGGWLTPVEAFAEARGS